MVKYDPCAPVQDTEEEIIKGTPFLIAQNQALAGVSRDRINCDKFNAVHFDVIVSGGSSAVDLTVEGCYAEGGVYTTIADPQGTRSVTVAEGFDVVVGTIWAQVRLGAVPAGQSYTIWATPYISPGMPTVNANIVTDTLSAIQVNTGALNLSDWLTMGLAGGIYQGTGTPASPTTGFKLYNSGGIGIWEMWGSGTKQVYADTDGKLYAAAGFVVLDGAGITLGTPAAQGGYIRFENDQALVWRNDANTADIEGWRVDSSDNLHAGASVDLANQQLLGVYSIDQYAGNFTLDNSGNVLFQGSLQVNGWVGFYGRSPASLQTVTGAKSGNAALASLLTALNTIGLITDSTTA